MVFSFHITTFYSVFICSWVLLQRHLLSNTRIKTVLYLVLLPTCWHEPERYRTAAECFHVASCSFRGSRELSTWLPCLKGITTVREVGRENMAGAEIKAGQMWSPLENTNASNYGWQRSYTMRFQLRDKALKLLFILLKQDLELQSYRQP